MHTPTANQTLKPYAGHRGRAPSTVVKEVSTGRRNAKFVEMMLAFRGHGGLLRSPEAGIVAECGRRSADVSVAGSKEELFLIQFDWDGSVWVPMFQFEPKTTYLCPKVRAVVHQLPSAMSRWDVAVWFASPNRGLNLQRPVSMVGSESDRVCAAAGLTCILG